MKRRVLFAYILLMASALVSAQNGSSSRSIDVGAHLGAGLSKLGGKPTVGTNSNGLGLQFGGDLQYYLNDNFNLSLATGLEFSLNKASFEADLVNDIYRSSDGDEEIYFRSAVYNLQDNITMMYLNIPLMVYYYLPMGEKMNVYAGAGFKFGIPLSGKFKQTADKVETSAYYPQYMQEINDPAFMGIGTFTDLGEQSGKLKNKFSVAFAIDLGVKMNELLAGRDLYVGLFADFGLSNTQKDDTHVVGYQQSADFEYHSAYSSMQGTTLNQTERIFKKVAPSTFGLKIRATIF